LAERQRDDDAVAVDAAPALGEVPERQQQAVVDALVVRDRQRDREVVRPARAAVEQLEPELRPGDDAQHQAVVEHGQARWLEHLPADLGAHVRALIVPAPRPHHVALADELDAVAPEHVDRAAEQAVDDQEAAVVDRGVQCRDRVPLARRQLLDARERLPARALDLSLAEQVGQVRIGVDEC
jgi:hypothetical protein